jgi:dTDP-4-dehydrorhamnose reductase
VERLLVTGIDYPLGNNLARALTGRCDVFGVFNRYALESPGISTAHCEAGDLKTLAGLVHEWQPKWILQCGPLAVSSWDTATAENEADDEPDVAAQLATLAAQSGARLTVVSSDVVFCGPRLFHEEGWPALNATPHADRVRDMERAVEGTDALVVRTHAYGWSPVPELAGFAQRAVEALSGGTAIDADGLRHATPILATDLAELLWRAHELRLHGLYHMAGAERISPWGFVNELAAALGLRCRVPCDTTGRSFDDTHDETSLNSKRARRALEMATPMIREGLDRFVAQAYDGWREHWHLVAHGRDRRELAA